MKGYAFLVAVFILVGACTAGRSYDSRDDIVVEHDQLQENTRNSHQGFIFSDEEYFWPAKGRVTSYFGPRWGRMHHGIDISNTKNSPIYSVAKGKVVFAGWKRGYGKTIVIKHNGFKTLYAHLNSLKVRTGFKVRKGQKIAAMGITGNARGTHLHFEWRTQKGQPLDPLRYLPKRATKDRLVQLIDPRMPTSFL